MYIDDEKSNCSFYAGDEIFNYRVGAIIIEEGCALLATNDSADYYYTVGGRVHLGETSHDAVLREVKEETGIDYGVDRPVFVNENFFVEPCGKNKKKRFHEICIFYLMKPCGKKHAIADGRCVDGTEHYRWVPLEKLKSIKRVYPEFLTDRICDLPSHVELLVTKTLD